MSDIAFPNSSYIPDEIKLIIFGYVHDSPDNKNPLIVSLVSKDWKRLFHDQALWAKDFFSIMKIKFGVSEEKLDAHINRWLSKISFCRIHHMVSDSQGRTKLIAATMKINDLFYSNEQEQPLDIKALTTIEFNNQWKKFFQTSSKILLKHLPDGAQIGLKLLSDLEKTMFNLSEQYALLNPLTQFHLLPESS